MVMGRPKEYDRIKIGQDMVEWAKNNPEALTVPMYAVSIDLHSGILRNWAAECKDFHALYMQAKEYIGINRLNCCRQDTLDNAIYQKTLAHYDCDTKGEIREEKIFERDLGTTSTDIEPNKVAIDQGHENMRLKNALELRDLEIKQLKEQVNANKS